MTVECDDDGLQRVIPVLQGSGPATPDPDAAILVEFPSDGDVESTARWDADVHASMIEGLASYVSSMLGAIAGRVVMFTHVSRNWAFHEEGPYESPTAAVYSTEVGKYDSTQPGRPEQLAPSISSPNRRVTLTNVSTYDLDQLEVMVSCEDDVQRAGVRHMLEDAFWPVEWMSGFRLVLPRYHNAIAEFLLVSAQQPDSTELAAVGRRPLLMRLEASCPVYRVRELPLAHPVFASNIVGKLED